MNRKSLRAPLDSVILYVVRGKVYRGISHNISQDGILMEYDSAPDKENIPIMLGIPYYPDFTKMNLEEIKGLGRKNDESGFFFDKKTIRLKIKPVRLFKKVLVNSIEKKFVGCIFVNISNKDKMDISRYISLFAKNMIFLLNLFEGQNPQHNIEALKALASFLGHDKNQKIGILRQKILHDYQSIEGL